jgi:hypothetical protein
MQEVRLQEVSGRVESGTETENNARSSLGALGVCRKSTCAVIFFVRSTCDGFIDDAHIPRWASKALAPKGDIVI